MLYTLFITIRKFVCFFIHAAYMVNKYCRTGKIQDMSNIRANMGTLL